jgi:UDP-N-acetylmuramoyl-L-alanyl-D-glutamate--2,6-diaminopimelate ligase
MFKEGLLDKTLYWIKKLIPTSVFDFFAPTYHTILAYLGALRYGFPSRSMKVIGVTGTKGKSTTVYMISKILEGAGYPVAAIGSLGYKIKEREWPNTLKMSMPGRFRLQKFLAEAKNAGCKYVVLEVTSEGIAQQRHLGVDFDAAVFINIHREHLERHGSFENYRQAKQELFKVTKNIHVLNADDANAEYFLKFPAQRKITFGINNGDWKAENISAGMDQVVFDVKDQRVNLNIGGEFNVLNAVAAMAVTSAYGVNLDLAAKSLNKISNIAGRMDFVQKEPFAVVVDYAHTPDSLEAVYKTLKRSTQGNLICVLGAAGGGRDKWKRPEFGKIASQYCDEIILADEDPFEENPNQILNEVKSGIPPEKQNVKDIPDRREAIKTALTDAKNGDIVVITGKGSETSMALAGGRKIPWSDRQVVEDLLRGR